MNMSSKDWWEYLKWASSHHLTEIFPDAILSDSETDEYEMHEERLKWIDNHAIERNEYRDRDDIFDMFSKFTPSERRREATEITVSPAPETSITLPP